jgi:hypothetical protein
MTAILVTMRLFIWLMLSKTIQIISIV